MRQATVFSEGMGFVMYGGGTATHFDSLSGLRAFVEANNINARFADDAASQVATVVIPTAAL